ncbi:ROK family protein [Bacillus anthracis]|nr:ROK family protein [Bacillus anthracis]
MKEYIAFDIGGTQIKYGIVSETGIVLKHKTVPTEIHLGGEQIIQKLILLSKN